jgi:hypothetical protein
VSPEQSLTDAVPAVVGIADIGAELPEADLVRADRRLGEPVDGAKVTKKLVDHGDRPGPGGLVGVLDEALHLSDAGIDRLKLQVSAELLITPALEHLRDRLFFGVQGPD